MKDNIIIIKPNTYLVNIKLLYYLHITSSIKPSYCLVTQIQI